MNKLDANKHTACMKKLIFLVTSLLAVCAIGIVGCNDKGNDNNVKQRTYSHEQTEENHDVDLNDDDGDCDGN